MSNHNLNELSEIQSKIITDRINQTEKNMNLLLESIASCNRKASQSRDKIDELSKVMKTLADGESHNESMGSALDEFSKSIVHMADIEDIKISRVEEKIIGELIQYELLCRHTREDVKNLMAARDREMAKRRNIEINKKTRGHGTSENEIMLSNIQLSKVLKELYATAESFEKQKLSDMKEILTNFILIQLKYFASGLELFSSAYEVVSSVDEKTDLEQFKKHLENENKTSSKFKFMKAFNMFSSSTSNLDRIGSAGKRKRSLGKSQSTMSLNSIDSNVSELEAEREKKEVVEVDTKTSDSEEDSDESTTTVDQSDTITEETSIAHQQPSSSALTRVKNAK